MPRDKKIKNIFEIADDGMQGVFGYFIYGIACKNASNKSKVIENLPDKQFPITHEWVRYYDPLQLYEEMTVYFDVYHARVSLIQ